MRATTRDPVTSRSPHHDAPTENAGLRRVLLDEYTPRYGAEWEAFLDVNVYVRIDADRMFTFHMPA
jgi:hypothetical protein